MKHSTSRQIRLATLLAPAALFAAMAFSAGAQAADFNPDAATALAKKNDCFKCHALEKTKKGPSYKKIAAKYKGKADAEEKLTKHLTSSPKVKLEDGTEEEHKALEGVDPKDLKNLINWILSQ
jgi:cytochrome c